MWCAECGEYFLPDEDYFRHVGSCPNCDKPLWGIIAYDPEQKRLMQQYTAEVERSRMWEMGLYGIYEKYGK